MSSSNVSGIKKLFGNVCRDSHAKYLLLKERDMFMNKERGSTVGTVIKGTMQEMCSEKERHSRMMSKNASVYETTNDEFVKDFARSAADQDLPLPHELRPIKALVRTMDYLMSQIASKVPISAGELIKWYEFIWSRTRGIRKDITQQRLVNNEVVDILEKCIRFHIYSGYKLSPLESFDSKMNIENLAKCLQSLRHCYDDLAKKEIYCENEAEFRAYDILLNMLYSGVASQACRYRQSVRHHQLVRNALSIATAYHCEEYRQIFKFIRSPVTTFLQACLVHDNFLCFRTKILTSLAASSPNAVELSILARLLDFDDKALCVEFLQEHGCKVKKMNPETTWFDLKGFSDNLNYRDTYSHLVEDKLTQSVAIVICGGPPVNTTPPKAIDSFDEQDRYMTDPVALKFIRDMTGENFVPSIDNTKQVSRTNEQSGKLGSSSKSMFELPKKPGLLGLPATTFAPKSSFPTSSNAPGFGLPTTKHVSFGFPKAAAPFGFKQGGGEDGQEDDIAKRQLDEALLRQTLARELEEKQRQEEILRQKLLAEEAERKRQEQVEAEKRLRAAEELARKKAEKAERVRKQNEREALKKVIANKIVNATLNKVVKIQASHHLKEEIADFKKLQKERRKAAKTVTRQIFSNLLYNMLLPIAEDVCDELNGKWERLYKIGQRIQQIRVEKRALRYYERWAWFTRWKKERRAIATFKEAVRNANDEPLKSVNNRMKELNFLRPTTDLDHLRVRVQIVRNWRTQRLERKFFDRWREEAPKKKAYRLWRKDFVSIPTGDENKLMSVNLWKKRTTVPLFRKRHMIPEPSALENYKRFHFDTPIPEQAPKMSMFMQRPGLEPSNHFRFSTPAPGHVPKTPMIMLSPIARV